MRDAVGLLIKGILRSRVGLALGLALIVLAIIGVARTFSGPTESPSLVKPPTAPVLATDPTVGDDGLQSVPPPPSPTANPGTTPPEIVARSFAAAWVNHRDVSAVQWHDALRPLSTAALTRKLADVDPVVVPAERLVGEPTLLPLTSGVVEVEISVDSGKLRLRLTAPDGRWLVDGVDWERG
ncbi:hypothetical protein [Micromonospora sp. NPDC049679]|uniref:hypothetical protein n=1 Tax=Micromonospora sp. NPDC049679 TaxID=3155920 RepID=UPI003408376A